MASLESILGWRNISNSIQYVESGVPNPFPSRYFTMTEPVFGDRTSYIEFFGERRVPRRTEYGAPSRAAVRRKVGEKSVTLVHYKEHIMIEQDLLLRLRQPNDLLAQKKAQEMVERAGRDFRTKFDNGRITAVGMMVATGNIYFDAAGNMLPTSSGAALDLAFGIPLGNQGQVGGIIDVSWANPASDIINQINVLQKKAVQTNGRRLTQAIYGVNVPNYLYTNTTAKNYWQFNRQLYDQFQANPGIIPQGTFGIRDWIPAGEVFFENPADTVNSYFPADQVTFGPDLTPDTYTMYEGSIIAPTQFGIVPDISSANSGEIIYGIGGYSISEIDPVGIKTVYFDTCLPTIKTPNDWYIVTVAF